MKLVLVAACALVDPDGRVLLAKRPPGKSMAGLWEFPGGKVETGETPEQTIIRELDEELAIGVSTNALQALTFASHTYEAFHLLMPLYLCRDWRGEPQACEHEALSWVPPHDMGSYDMPPADVPLVYALCSELRPSD